METRTLGRVTAPAQRLGCTGMSEFHGTSDQAAAGRGADMSGVHR